MRGPRPATSENPAGLTRREREVLELLAEGLTNAEIAARLVISEKTVGHHVSAILGKLGVGSRYEAAKLPPKIGSSRPKIGSAPDAAPSRGLLASRRPTRRKEEDASLPGGADVSRRARDPLDRRRRPRLPERGREQRRRGRHLAPLVRHRGRRKTFCVYDGPTPEAVRQTAARNGLPVDAITPVRVLDPYFHYV